MQLHEIKPTHKKKRPKRIGRGGKKGTYSGKGSKGQKARAGAKIKSQFREMVAKFPKKRGDSFQRFNFTEKPLVLNLSRLIHLFPQGGIITPQILREKAIIKPSQGKLSKIKILGQGKEKLAIKFIISNCLVSQEAKKAVEKAGGKVN